MVSTKLAKSLALRLTLTYGITSTSGTSMATPSMTSLESENPLLEELCSLTTLSLLLLQDYNPWEPHLEPLHSMLASTLPSSPQLLRKLPSSPQNSLSQEKAVDADTPSRRAE